ncbi:DUF3318 domain-containing protein [Merismopedia glauca]|uniref:DUF3318 domain-containing protein n=1 Tax=Merismopedia glauca CCAP 1448/3 TaxID=1296344 RepID=A0A2T1BZS1_9CYAN|nr:DUF3318 domain-containing protein [Merismopedia glauca]PSB01417.1 hypothetical protein C7B64_18450 [Merismopedia glauca CCAP 1448/3]
MNLDPEVSRLLDLMPASARMMTKLVAKPEQRQVIYTDFPVPWQREKPIYLNFDLWRRLSKPERDLLLLSTVSWVTGIKWFKPDIYQGVVLAGVLGTIVELAQSDAVGIVVAGGLTGLAATQIWRSNRSSQTWIEADKNAIAIAGRRGYQMTEAATHLLSAIVATAQLEGRTGLDFVELLRCQNLRAIANISPVGIPEDRLKHI